MAAPKKVGRTSKFTPETKQKLIDLISVGVTDKDACGSAGVDTVTFYQWLAIGRAHLNEDPHERMPHKLEDREAFGDFVNAIARARASSNNAALIAFKTGLREAQIVEETTETFSETRLDPSNKPYVYSRTTTRSTVRKQPPDWRAGEAWLKRRDPDNWSDKLDARTHTGASSWEDIMKTLTDDNEAGSNPDPFD